VSIQRALIGWAVVGLLALSGCTDELAVPTEPLRMLRTDFPVAFLGEPFEAQFRPSGGLRPYRFSLRDGELPPGLELTAGGLRGTPTAVGRFNFTIAVRDGNLSQTIQELTLDVRPLPEPVVRLDAPGTELREPLALTLRVEDARGWRGTRVALRWDPELFELAEEPKSAAPNLALFSQSEPGWLLLELAALGEARQGAFPLARVTFAPIDPPARLSLNLAAATRYSGGEHTALRLEGAPATPAREVNGTRTTPPGAAEDEPEAPEGSTEAAEPDDATVEEPSDEDAPEEGDR
jgi:hypothetical protein